MFDGGFSAESLAVFTAASPAGAVAFACLAAFLLARRGLAFDERLRLGHFLLVPLAVAWAGFIASATHLGTPANALHSIAGIGRSPLSNEVVAAVAFLFFAGIAWMYSYRAKPSVLAFDVLCAASVVSAAGLVALTSLAYAVPTVPSWDTWLAPANLIATALFSGPALAALTLQLSRADARRWPSALLAVSAAALVVGTALLLAHAGFLATVSNNVTSAASLVPHYGATIAAHALLGALGIAAQAYGRRVSVSHARGAAFSVIGCMLVLVAALLCRLPFYASYLSVGF